MNHDHYISIERPMQHYSDKGSYGVRAHKSSQNSDRAQYQSSQSSKQRGRKLCTKYELYYFCKLFFNIFLVSLYIAQVFTEHETCTSKNGRDLTKYFTQAFRVGFIILIVDCINSTLLTIYFRDKAQREEIKYGVTSGFTRRIAEGTITLEQLLRFVIIICSFYQYATAHSKYADYCMKKLGVLEVEGTWLTALFILQIFKGFLFMIWEVMSIHRKKDDWNNAYGDFSDYSFSDQESQYSRKSARSQKELIYANDVERQYINRYLNKQGIETYISGGDLSESDGEHSRTRRQSSSKKDDESQQLLSPYYANKKAKKAKSEKRREQDQVIDKDVQNKLESLYNQSRKDRLQTVRNKLLSSSRQHSKPRTPVSYSSSFRPQSQKELKENSLLSSTMQDISVDSIATIDAFEHLFMSRKAQSTRNSKK